MLARARSVAVANAVVFALVLLPHALGDVSTPAIFGSHMVLQRERPNKLWGWAEPGEAITVTLNGKTLETKADANGNWSMMLEPLPTGGPYEMTIQGKNKLTYQDILAGEVWVCSGQSNMQWSVEVSNDPDLESKAANFPQIRLITVPNVGTQDPQKDFRGEWTRCTPDSVKGFSAVGYFFGRQLHQVLGVPIGLIDNAWGGSACEAWINRDRLAADPKYKDLLDSWSEREKQYGELQAAAEKAKAEGGTALGAQELRGLEGQMKGNHRPANIYNGALKPTIGFGIRGAIWYQGESNAGRAYQYRTLFPLMIKNWREDWGIGDFPFYFVQLADFMQEKTEPGDSGWAELREAQTMTLAALPNTGQAVIIDLGEAQDIHPRNKQDVAMRLARWALAKDYGVEIPYRSPQYQSMEVKEGKVILTFDHVGAGLRAFDVAEVRGFTLAGDDRKFHPAVAKITGKNTIEVSSSAVSHPVSVRYAWADNPVCNVYSREGLPLTPFRTDDWEGVTAKATK